MAAPKKQMTMADFQRELQALRRAVFNQPRLRLEDIQHRYGWSRTTVFRRLRDRTLPGPIRFPGQPLWREEDLLQAELAGQLPDPVSA